MTAFQIKEEIDNIIYILYNVLSSFLFCLKFKTKKRIAKNKIFQNKHNGQRCFILGCGPSLKNLTQEEISFLKDEVTIGVNELFRSSFLKDIIPTYYFMVDNAYWTTDIDIALNAFDTYKDKPTVFFTNIKAYHILIPKKEGQLYYLYAKFFPVRRILNRMDKNQTISMNVVIQAIQAAMYMGFKEIYLLGCDYTAFATPLDTHCYDSNVLYKKENLGFYLKFYEFTTRIHYLVARKASKEFVSIFNLTIGSLLDAYPKKKLGDLLF